MADNQETKDSLAFSALANGIFQESTDVPSGQAALIDAYKSATWTDPKAAEEELKYYGNALRYKLEDQTPHSAQAIEEESPIPLNSPLLPKLEEESLQEYYTRWEEANLEYLDTQKTPEYLVANDQWKQDISDYAKVKRREANAARADEITEKTPDFLKPIAKFNQGFKDLENRAIRGITTPFEPLINFIANRIPGVDGYELNSHLTEYTDPRNDASFVSQVVEGLGQAVGTGVAFAAGPIAGTAAVVMQALDPVVTRREETLRRTGDPTKANTAAAIELGSQAIQTFGERLVFGKAGKLLRGEEKAAESVLDAGLKANPEKGLLGEVVTGAATEAVAEGTGQVISQQAEDIEQNKTTSFDENVDRAFNAAAVGAVVAAPAGVITSRNAVPSKGNSDVRAKEIQQNGYPITPVTKQVVGKILPGETTDTQAIAAPSEVDSVALSDPQQLAPQQESVTDTPASAIANIKTIPAYTTEDGSNFVKTEDGFYISDKGGAQSLPHDTTVFADDTNGQKVIQAIASGENVILGDKGKVYIEHIEQGKTPTYEEVSVSDTPAPGAYAFGISKERSPDSQTKVRPIDIPRKIADVSPVDNSQSVGAAYSPYSDKESAFSFRSKQVPTLAEGMFDAGIEGFLALNRTSTEGRMRQVAEYVDAKGMGALLSLIDGTSDDTKALQDPEFIAGATTFLENFLAQEAMSGDVDRVEAAKVTQNIYGQRMSDIRSKAGNLLYATQGVDATRQAAGRVAKKTLEAYDKALAEAATEEGATPDEVKQAPKIVEETTKQVEQATTELQQAEKTEGQPITTPETQAEDQAIADIESQANDTLATDLNNIDQEAADLTEEIRTTEKKAERQKRKDIAAVEAAIAKDGEQLANEVASSIDLTDITAEEKAKLEQTIQDTVKAAEEKANAEITKAVKEERAAKQAESKSALERATESLARANESLNKAKLVAQERLRKLTYERNQLEKAGKDLSATDAKIQKVEESVTKAAQRLVDTKQRLADLQNTLSAENEANKQAEEIYKELESGVTVAVTPQRGNRRAISLKTKKGGLDITKLFKANKDVGAPLGALSKAVNELSGVVKQAIGARATSNANLTALENRINANKKALDAAKAADALDAAARKRVDAARKRLEKLAQAKSEATLESRVSPRTKKLYKDLKDRQANRPKSDKSEAVKEAAKKLNEARAKQRRALKLLEKQKLAQQLAAAAAAAQNDKERKIEALKNLLKEGRYEGTSEQDVKLKLARAESEANPTEKNLIDWLGVWTTSLVGSPLLTSLAMGTGIVNFAATAAFQALPLSLMPAMQNLARGEWAYKLPILHLLAGAADRAQLGRSWEAAKIAFKTGQRIQRTVGKEKIKANLGIRLEGSQDASDANLLGVGEDAFTMLRNLKYEGKNPAIKALVAAHKTLGLLGGISMRSLMASEAMVFGQAYNGFADYSNAREYNKAVSEGRSTAPYEVNKSDALKIAEAKAAAETKKINEVYKAAGVEGPGISKAQERIRAFELLQQAHPEETQVFAFKMAAQLVLNGPAGGFAGEAASIVNHVAKRLGVGGTTPARYLAAFSNAIAHSINASIPYVPIAGLAEVAFSKQSNLTPAEQALRMSAALTSTTVGVGIAMLALDQLDKPEDERWFDITSRYSTDAEKLQAFLEGGGLQRAIKIGGTWIPYPETALGMWLATVGEIADTKRNSKPSEPVVQVNAMLAAYNLAIGSAAFRSAAGISMTKGVVDIYNNLVAIGSKDTITEEKKVALLKTLYSPLRGTLVPSSSFLKFLARFTDNPVDSKRDLTSAVVEGIPGLQSMFGKPALNIFGEPLKADTAGVKVHRLFSNKKDDLDIRWLADNGYQIKGIANLELSKDERAALGMDKASYDAKYNTMKAASAELRSTVRSFREYYGNSAHREEVQKALNSKIQGIFARHLSEQVQKQ